MELDIPMLNNIADALDMAICEMESHFDLLNDDNIHYPYTLKHTITNLTSSVELLIKFRLMQEHWAFIFSDINRATIEKLETGDFISVDFTTGIERLKNICELNNSFIECHKLRNMRNRIELNMPSETEQSDRAN